MAKLITYKSGIFKVEIDFDNYVDVLFEKLLEIKPRDHSREKFRKHLISHYFQNDVVSDKAQETIKLYSIFEDFKPDSIKAYKYDFYYEDDVKIIEPSFIQRVFSSVVTEKFTKQCPPVQGTDNERKEVYIENKYNLTFTSGVIKLEIPVEEVARVYADAYYEEDEGQTREEYEKFCIHSLLMKEDSNRDIEASIYDYVTSNTDYDSYNPKVLKWYIYNEYYRVYTEIDAERVNCKFLFDLFEALNTGYNIDNFLGTDLGKYTEKQVF